MKIYTYAVLACLFLSLAPGCVKVKTEVEPIDINVNVRLEVDRELDEFFGEVDAKDSTLTENTGGES